MQFQSVIFLIFFFALCIVYYAIPGKLKKYWLFLVSWIFYLSISFEFPFYLLIVTLFSYAMGIMVERISHSSRRKRNLFLAFALVGTFSALTVIKYGGFFTENVARFLHILQVDPPFSKLQLVQPIGLSFFTFQAAGYLIDIYRSKRPAEKNIISYALFLSFFPIIMSGPIERSTNLLAQIDESDKIRIDTNKIRHGLLEMMYGYFLKIMVADRLNIFVNSVFSNHEAYGGGVLTLAVIGFGIQLYCDFAGISTIALGAGEVLGFSLIRNFETPYFSLSVGEFWRRWHISLSTWFRDYLYIPLGGNRKGIWRKYLNLMIVFLVSGLWHGSGWSFIVWGGLHGIYQIMGGLLKPARLKIISLLHINPDLPGNRFLKMLFNFALINFAWLFFRAESLTQSIQIISQSISMWNLWELFDGTLLTLGLDWPDILVLILSLIIVLVMSVCQYKKIDWKTNLMSQGFLFRATVYVTCITILVIFGIYGSSYSASSFIYVDF